MAWTHGKAWWRHQLKPFSALFALCEGNPLVTAGFPSQRPVAASFDVFFDLCLNNVTQATIHNYNIPEEILIIIDTQSMAGFYIFFQKVYSFIY